MSEALEQTDDPCPFEPVIDLVFGRWTSHVLWALVHEGPLRFGELKAQMPTITPKTLTERLRRLERDGFVTRTYYAEMPPRVEYDATELAQSLIPAFRVLADWASEHLDEVSASRRRFDEEAASPRMFAADPS